MSNSISDLLTQTLTDEEPKVVDIKESEDKNIYLILNESTGETNVGFETAYEKELYDDLKLIAEAQERIDKKKAEIKKFLEENEHGSFKTDLLNVTYTSATTTTTLDQAKIKKEMSVEWIAAYSKVGTRASSITVKPM